MTNDTGAWPGHNDLRDRLTRAGLSAAAATAKVRLLMRAVQALPKAPTGGAQAFFVPGRIEILGKHTDYAGGRSMLVATDKGFCMVLRARDDAQVSVTDVVQCDSVHFEMHPDLTPPVGHWSNYPMAVARRIVRNFRTARRGVDLVIGSDLPAAAGMSSSSAFVVAVFLALSQVNDLSAQPAYQSNIDGPTDLAGYLGTVENGQSFKELAGHKGVGTFGGSEDHTAILCCRPNQISQYAYCPVRFQRGIQLPDGYTFAVGASGVVAEKAGGARERFNRASLLSSALIELWRERTNNREQYLADAMASAPDALETLQSIVKTSKHHVYCADALLRRLEHFQLENNQIIPAAGDALDNGDLASFGKWVDRSQQGAERLLGNQIPETIYLAATARNLGAPAASAFGAGFGGSVWALIKSGDADTFLAAWADGYRRKFPRRDQTCSFFTTAAGPAALRLC